MVFMAAKSFIDLRNTCIGEVSLVCPEPKAVVHGRSEEKKQGAVPSSSPPGSKNCH